GGGVCRYNWSGGMSLGFANFGGGGKGPLRRILDAGVDDPAKILTRLRYCVKCGCSSKVYNYARPAIARQCCHSVNNTISANFARIIIQESNSCVSCVDEYRLDIEIQLGHFEEGEIKRRHY